MKNITFTADEEISRAAREQAAAEQTSLNEQFCRWLESYARKHQAARAKRAIDRLAERYSSGGRQLTRREE